MVSDILSVDELAEEIRIALADFVEEWGLAPPADVVAARESGHLFKDGWYLGWVFGQEEGREYFEWVTEHRMADMEHRRVFADGEELLLDTPRSGYVYPEGATDEYLARLEAGYLDWNRRVYAELRERGLLPPEGGNPAGARRQ